MSITTKLMAVIALLTTLSMAACTPSKTPGTPNAGHSGTPGDLNGTVSGGGGNGIDGAALESYSIDVQKLPEYQLYIAPILRRLAHASNPDPILPYLNWAVLNKTWYIVPVALDRIPQERLSLTFVSDQLARQNEKEIFVSTANPTTNKSNLSTADGQIKNKKKAYLILHEMVMAARYLMKKSPEDQCLELSKNNFKACKDAEIMKLAKVTAMSVESQKTMTTDDVEAVRSMTVFLMAHDQDLSAANVTDARRRLGFQFPWDHITSTVSAADVTAALRRASLVGESYAEPPAAELTPGQLCYFFNTWLPEENFNDAFDHPDAGQVQFLFTYASAPSKFIEVEKRNELFTGQQDPKLNVSFPWAQKIFLTTLEKAITIDVKTNFSAQGTVYPANSSTIVDHIWIDPPELMDRSPLVRGGINQQDQKSLGQFSSDSYRAEIFLSREDQPRVLEVRFIPVRVVVKASSVRVPRAELQSDDLEYLPLKNERIRKCLLQ